MDPARNEFWGWLGEFSSSNVVSISRISQVTLSCGRAAYEKLVLRTEMIQPKVPDCCKVFIVRSLLAQDVEKDLLKIHPTANYKTTKEYILEQASFNSDAHFDDEGKHEIDGGSAVSATLADCWP